MMGSHQSCGFHGWVLGFTVVVVVVGAGGGKKNGQTVAIQ